MNFQHKTYRVEWQVQCGEVDQYGQNFKSYRTDPFPTREEALAFLPQVATLHERLERWIPRDSRHGYCEAQVVYREVEANGLVERVAAELMADHCAAAMALAKRDRLLDSADAWVAADDEFNKLETAFRDNLRTALAVSGTPAAGVWVPVSPTQEQVQAAADVYHGTSKLVGWLGPDGMYARIYRAMIAAKP
jgi:hypothetical protein